MTDKETMAKAWAFNNGVSQEQIEKAWDNAIEKGNFIIRNLDKNGKKWWWLGDNPTLLQQLIERFGQ